MTTNSQRPLVVVVGGGTAGWLAACHLAKVHHPAKRVLLIESPDIPPIGVGEGTVPAIRESLRYLGVSESDIIQQCDATFKQSIRFSGWRRDFSRHPYYHHVFDYPLGGQPLARAWCQAGASTSFADVVGIQARLCDANLAPKRMTDTEYEGIASYAYHFDAAKFSALLKRHGTQKLGVEYIADTVLRAEQSASGEITQLMCERQGPLSVDFVVDATGFSASLFSRHYDVRFVDCSSQLFVDSALVAQVSYPQQSPIPCFTDAVAHEAGWIWDIGLQSRRGTGFVYSSAHCSDQRAQSLFEQYLGSVEKVTEIRKIPMRVGFRETFWQENCVAIGLAQGFVEPLEATGLLMFDATSRLLAELLPVGVEARQAAAKRFNARAGFAWQRVVDFIKLHYAVSDRDDSDFWHDNRNPNTWPESLRENMALWRERLPSDIDFGDAFSIFHQPNFLYVLLGMNVLPDQSDNAGNSDLPLSVQGQVRRMEQEFGRVQKQLLSHRELLDRIRQYGIQAL